MPDRSLPDHVRQRLARAIESGSPLSAPQPGQARYVLAAAAGSRSPLRGRFVLLGAACIALLLLGLAGSAQPRGWIMQSAVSFAKGITAPAAPSASDRSHTGSAATPQAAAAGLKNPSPSAKETPEATESPEPATSPEPSEATESSPSPEPRDGGSSPTPEPSDGYGDRTGPSASPSPSPSPLPSGGD